MEMVEVRNSEWDLLWAIMGDRLRLEDDNYVYLKEDLVAYTDGQKKYMSRSMYVALQGGIKEIKRLSSDKIYS